MEQNKIFCANPLGENSLIIDELNDAVRRAIDSTDYILGPSVKRFEDLFAEYIGMNHCVGVNTGTDALSLSLKALGVGAKDEVITTSHTAVATAAAIASVGATPVFVDIDSDSFNLDTSKIEEAITARTKAIICVHIYGNPCDMHQLKEICKRNSLFLIEDCAQAHGAEHQGKKVGSFGDISCFSFYPTKNLGAIGDAGAVLVNDPQLASELKKLRQYGWDSERNSQRISGVSRLDEIQASILLVKLKYLDQNNSKRNLIANMYFERLKKSTLVLPKIDELNKHVFHLFVVKSLSRDALIRYLNSKEIFPGIHYKLPVHLQPAYSSEGTSLPVTENISDQIISLPMYPTLTEAEVTRITKEIISFEESSNG